MGLKIISLLLSIALASGSVHIPKEKAEIWGIEKERQETVTAEIKGGTKESGKTKGHAEPEDGVKQQVQPEAQEGAESGEYEGMEEGTEPEDGVKQQVQPEAQEGAESGEYEGMEEGAKPEDCEEPKEPMEAGEGERPKEPAEEGAEPEEAMEVEEGERPEESAEPWEGIMGDGKVGTEESAGLQEDAQGKKKGESLEDEMHMPVFYATRIGENEKYVDKSGYFYIYVRKQGDSPENGHWYKLNMSVPELTAQKSQDIAWDMAYIGKMPKKETGNIKVWIGTHGNSISKENDIYSLKIEKGKKWEKTRQDGYGINPVFGEPAPDLDKLRPLGYPYKERYYMLCGKLLYTVKGYRMYFDNSVFSDMGGMDIEPENKRIQKKYSKLDEGEDPWTGDGYFKFSIDTNNVGMTNYGASGEFHHSMYGFYLKPNQYNVKYDANGGTGTVAAQSATYDEKLTLQTNSFVREGYTFAGWNTASSGSGTDYSSGQTVKNLTAVHKGTVTLYAKWKPNTLTVTYNANGGYASGTPYNIEGYASNWNYATSASAPEKFSSFGLSREGYSPKYGAEWNTATDGTGAAYSVEKTYGMLAYAPDLKNGDRKCLLYAQWEPNVYTITLDRCLADLEDGGTGAVYEKYEKGWYLDKGCASLLADKNRTGSIAVPKKNGYVFLGYYNAATGGTQMIDGAGKMTSAGKADFRHKGDATWYARYKCQISCEDYADVPCDFEKTDDDSREGTKAVVICKNGQVTVTMGQSGFDASLVGKPAGTKVGQFQSAAAGNSASAFSGNMQTVVLPMAPQENAAYQLKVTVQGKVFCDRAVYYKDGRFRTLVKLGEKEKKEANQGSSIAGSSWGTEDAAYPLYRYVGCSELKNIQSPGSVCRYFQYKNANMAYSGNGATSGKNILEYNVPLENIYQFRENPFGRKETKTKQTQDGKSYQCEVKYRFDGWELSADKSYLEQQEEPVVQIYRQAKGDHAVMDRTAEPLAEYQTVGSASDSSHLLGYINLLAKWNAFPTIVVTPGSSLEFYEGEEVAKEDLISRLTAHDEEDNNKENQPNVPNLNDKIRIVKIVYPESQNRSQRAYEKAYQKDVPKDFLLDTYYLKLEKEEEIKVMVTFAVTDSNGNTTEEEFPVKVKYNNYPEIDSEDIFYYFKEEANRGEITAGILAKRATAEDAEDGNLTDKLGLKDFDGQVIKMQTESSSEFDITYEVTDAYKKTSYKTVKLVVMDEGAVIAEMPKYYVRYIAKEHLDTLEKDSVWREPENYAYLKRVLENETSVERWEFTHEDVLAVQEWMTGNGNWKTGQETNLDFLAEFSHCRQ